MEKKNVEKRKFKFLKEEREEEEGESDKRKGSEIIMLKK